MQRPIAATGSLTNRAQPTTRRGFLGLLMAIAATLGVKSAEYNQIRSRGYRNGKHNGRNPGAFGGGKAAKSHRVLYVRQSETSAT